jgi:hypothetical protein
MKLYHFTHEDALPSILEEGLNRGEVPLTPTKVENAVWLTTDPSPGGHGVFAHGGIIVTREIALMLASQGLTARVGDTLPYADKQKIRIKVEFQTSRTRGLMKWIDFAKKRKIESDWLRSLYKGAGDHPKPHTWWLWFGTLSPELFQAIEVRSPGGGYVSIWERPDLLTEEVRIAIAASQKFPVREGDKMD